MRTVRRALVIALLSVAVLRPATADAEEQVPAVVTASDAWVDYGKAGSVSVTVGADGAAAPGEVTARLGDRVLGTAVLDDGVGAIEIPARALLPRAAPYELTVAYAGDGAVAGGTDTAELKVRRGRVFVWATVTPKRLTAGEDRVSAIVEILNVDGLPRSGVVTLSAKGAGSRSTAIQGGRATLRLPPFRAIGHRTVVVGYGGSTLLRPARAVYEVVVVPRSRGSRVLLARNVSQGSRSARNRPPTS